MKIIYDNINNYTDYDYQNMLNSLNDMDKDKISKLLKVRNRKLSILSKYLLKSILSQNYHLDYNNIYFNANGKPLINEIYFNISHSFDLVVIVFSNKKIGVDIERIRKVDLNIINKFCNNKEKEYILKSNNIYRNLFEFFCLKEAYFKMLGTNLFNMKSIEFNIENNNVIASINDLNIILNSNIDNYIIAIVEENIKK